MFEDVGFVVDVCKTRPVFLPLASDEDCKGKVLYISIVKVKRVRSSCMFFLNDVIYFNTFSLLEVLLNTFQAFQLLAPKI